MDRPTRPIPFSMLRSSLTLGLVVAAGLPVAWAALRIGGAERYTTEMLAGAGVGLVAAVLGLVPVRLGSRRGGADTAVPGVLGGLVLRLSATVVGGTALAVAGVLHPLALAIAASGWYLLLLLTEIVLLHRFLARAGSASGEEAAW
jgi:hypothetical protein